MKLTLLRDAAPWDWPEDAGEFLLETLRAKKISEEDLLLATELAGDYTVINDELADALLDLLHDVEKPEAVRGAAAISLGPVLETGDADEFEDPDFVPISEEMFDKIRASLQALGIDTSVPTYVRRRVMEAAVRSPMEWQKGVIRTAYSSADPSWRLTAVFCMRYVKGFEKEILEALTGSDAEMRIEAMLAAGNWEMDAAWPHVVAVVMAASEIETEDEEEKDLLLAAIGAAGFIRPKEAMDVLGDLLDSDDGDIVEAVQEVLVMARVDLGDEDDSDDDLGALLDDDDEIEH